MFTTIVRIWLFVILTGFATLLLQNVYVTFRDGRKNRRLLAAHRYAQLVVSDRILKGELNFITEVQSAYEFEKNNYLNQ